VPNVQPSQSEAKLSLTIVSRVNAEDKIGSAVVNNVKQRLADSVNVSETDPTPDAASVTGFRFLSFPSVDADGKATGKYSAVTIVITRHLKGYKYPVYIGAITQVVEPGEESDFADALLQFLAPTVLQIEVDDELQSLPAPAPKQ
jgi:hypothetical protein